MIKINKAILHVYDMLSNITIFSEKELSLQDEGLQYFLNKHLEKAYHDISLKDGAFTPESYFLVLLNKYLGGEIAFIDFSSTIAERLFDLLSHSANPQPVDFIVCDVTIDEVPHVAFFICSNKTGYVHQVIHEGESVSNTIIQHFAILPSAGQRIDECFFIDTMYKTIKFTEKKRILDGKESYIVSDSILECSKGVSVKETVKLIHDITEKVAERYNEDSVSAVAKVKNYMMENLEDSDNLCPFEVGREIFQDSPAMQDAFISEMKDAGNVPTSMKVDKSYVARTEKVHKIKTDTGIEISFPADYYQNNDMIEFINNPNGTFSIQLKNISKIINK